MSCPADAEISAFHEALVVAFGWPYAAIYGFDIFDGTDYKGRVPNVDGGGAKLRYAGFDTIHSTDPADTRNSAEAVIYKVLDSVEANKQTLVYDYNLREGWEHIVSVTGRAAPTSQFVCVDGEGHGCAEDVGGHSGWADLLTAYDAVNPTQDQKDKIEWFENQSSNGDSDGLRGEKKLMWDKDRVNEVLRELHKNPLASTAGVKVPKYPILLISLSKMPFFDDMYAPVLAELSLRANLSEVTHISSAMHQMLRAPEEYYAVIVTDPEVMEEEYYDLHQLLVDYAAGGGTVVFAFHVSSFAHFDVLETFFRYPWKLNWKVASYTRDDFNLNPRTNCGLFVERNPNLFQTYSMKALHLKGCEPDERVYISSPDSTGSPAIFASYEIGYVGWIGDVNVEDGTTKLLLAMCDLES